MHGKGNLKQKDGSCYIGDFAADTRSGIGILNFKDGTKYEGEFLLNRMKGKGFIKTQDMEYRGEFKEDKPDGRGVMIYGEDLKLKHEGMFKEGIKHGRGTFTTNEDNVFITSWYMGRKEGQFFLKSPNGAVSEGLFKDDNIIGDITTKF